MPTRLPPRIAGFSYRGPHRYHVVLNTHRRLSHFTERETCERFVEVLRTCAVEAKFDLLVYCVMLDHVHVALEGLTEAADLRRLMRTVKQRAGFTFMREKRERLWQKGWFDHVLRHEESTPDVCRYIAANPVRAGLAATPREYPYLGSTRYTIDDLMGGLEMERCRPTG